MIGNPSNQSMVENRNQDISGGRLQQEWQNSSGVVQLAIDESGYLEFQTNTTSASAGTNGAVPAQVAGYTNISIGGAIKKIAYFNA